MSMPMKPLDQQEEDSQDPRLQNTWEYWENKENQQAAQAATAAAEEPPCKKMPLPFFKYTPHADAVKELRNLNLAHVPHHVLENAVKLLLEHGAMLKK